MSRMTLTALVGGWLLAIPALFLAQCAAGQQAPLPPPDVGPPPAQPVVNPPQPQPVATAPDTARPPLTQPEKLPPPKGQLIDQTERKTQSRYQLYLPGDYKADRQWPLVVAFPEEPWRAMAPDHLAAWLRAADKHGWVVLIPLLDVPLHQNLGKPSSTPEPGAEEYGRKWRESFPAATAAGQAQVSEVLGKWSVDRARMFVAAGRFAGELAASLATDRPKRFAALALLSCEMRTDVLDAKKARENKMLRVLITWAEKDTRSLGDGTHVVTWFRAAGPAVDVKVYPGNRQFRLEDAEKFFAAW